MYNVGNKYISRKDFSSWTKSVFKLCGWNVLNYNLFFSRPSWNIYLDFMVGTDTRSVGLLSFQKFKTIENL